MLADQFAGAISCAQFSDLNDLAHKLWKSHAAGHLDDDQAQALAEQIEARKPKNVPSMGHFAPAAVKPKRQRSPDKQASIERRRELARRSPVPPEYVKEFSLCEHAAITIMVDEIRRHGVCGLCKDAIAALAGTCATIVRMAAKKASGLGLFNRIERRRRGQKSLTNLITIRLASWRRWVLWIARRKMRTTLGQRFKTAGSEAVDSFEEERSRAMARQRSLSG